MFYSKPHAHPAQKTLAEINEPYAQFEFKPKKPRIQVYKQSLAEAHPELVHALDDLDRFSFSFDDYVSQYRNLYRRDPTSFELRQFYQNRFNLFKYQTNQWTNQLHKISRPMADSVRKNLAQVTREYGEVVGKIKKDQRIYKFETDINNMTRRIAGISGEMRALISLPGVKHYSKTLNEVPELATMIRERIKHLKNEVTQNPEQWTYIQSHYDEIFGREVLDNLIRKDKFGILDNVEQWVLSKEIDFVRFEGDRIKWIEFKVNAKPFDFDDDFPMTQIRQYSQIVDFLGLNNKVDLQYLATGGMTDSLKGELKQLDVQVINIE